MGIQIAGVVLGNAPKAGYVPGTRILGHVVVKSTKHTRIAGITLSIEGRAKVSFRTHEIRWFKLRFNQSRSEGKEILMRGGIFDIDWSSIKVRRRLSDSEVFYNKEKYCEINHVFAQNADLEIGDNIFNFDVLLPAVLPSSFNPGNYASIKYKIKVKVSKVESLSMSEHFKSEFIVNAPKEPIMYQHTCPKAFDPMVYREMKSFSFLLFPSGELTLSLNLPRSLFYPGETVMLPLGIENNSDVNVLCFKLKFCRRIVLIGKRTMWNVMFKDDVLSKISFDGVTENCNRNLIMPLVIPSVPSINIEPCSFIKLHYIISVEAVVEGLHMNLTMTAPVDIITDTSTSDMPHTSAFHPDPPSIGFTVPQPSHSGFTEPHSSNIGFENFSPSAPVNSCYNDNDPPPPYPGTPESAPPLYDKTF